MLDIRIDLAITGRERVLALPVIADGSARLLPSDLALPEPLLAEIATFLADVDHEGAAGPVGAVHALPRPGRVPQRVLLVGVGEADERGWRAAGAALARAAARETTVTVAIPPTTDGAALCEGLWLASYRFG